MRPILFYIGPFPVFSYGIFILLGVIVLFTIALNLGRRANLKWGELVPTTFGVGVGGVLGARLSHLLVEPDKLIELLNFYSLFRPGTPGNIVGLMIGGYLGGTLVRLSLNLPSLASFYAPAMAAASVIWRIGCTLAGCCYGKQTELPWAIFLENANRHPTMIYEGLFNLVMFFVIWRLRSEIKLDDGLLFLYFAGYAFFRFWLEFIRVYPPIIFGLTGVQYLCLGTLLGLSIWFWQQRFGQNIKLLAKKEARG